MTDLPDISKHDPAQNIPLWAKERAREFQRQHNQGASLVVCSVASLAALLVEVDENACHQTIVEMSEINEGEWARCKRETLAEVRRVVEDEIEMTRGTYWVSKSGTHLGDGSAPLASILSRLDAL